MKGSPRFQWRRLLAPALFLVATGLLTAACWPLFSRLVNDPAARQRFIDWVNSFGAGGVLVLLLIQVLQVVVAFIPGEPIEVIAGVLYGSWGGTALSLFGVVVGSSLVFLGVRRFGARFVRMFINPDEMEKYRFLNSTTRLESLVFLLFLIPGTPKDALTYVAAITPIRLHRFLLLSVFARIPSVLSSAMAGAALGEGEYLTSLAIFAAIAVIGLGGIWLKPRILAHMQRRQG